MEPDCKADEVEPCIGYLEVKEQRDELVEALREMLEAHDHGNSFSDEEVQDARDLLAKLDTGTKPRPSSVE